MSGDQNEPSDRLVDPSANAIGTPTVPPDPQAQLACLELMAKMGPPVSLGIRVVPAMRHLFQLRLKGAAESAHKENLGHQERLDPLDLRDLLDQADLRDLMANLAPLDLKAQLDRQETKDPTAVPARKDLRVKMEAWVKRDQTDQKDLMESPDLKDLMGTLENPEKMETMGLLDPMENLGTLGRLEKLAAQGPVDQLDPRAPTLSIALVRIDVEAKLELLNRNLCLMPAKEL